LDEYKPPDYQLWQPGRSTGVQKEGATPVVLRIKTGLSMGAAHVLYVMNGAMLQTRKKK
jgi:hypothetical protein